MGLSDVLSTSRNSLHITTEQMGNVSRNISNVNNPDYVRRTMTQHAFGRGGAYNTISRDSNPILLANYLSKLSAANGHQTLFEGYDRLNSIYNAKEFSNSPRQVLAEFQRALQGYANDPSHKNSAAASVLQARNFVQSLKHGTEEIAHLRQDADNDIKASVDRINGLLKKLEQVEKSIAMAKDRDENVFSYMDERDGILKGLSAELHITVNNNADGSVSVYAANGVTLYDHAAREVSFKPSIPLGVAKEGNPVYVDGVPLDHTTFSSPNGGGQLGNLLKLRDEVAPLYQKQLDHMARALVDIFQTDADGNKIDNPLFIISDNDDKKLGGLAGRIEVNPAYIAEEGGDPEKLGDARMAQNFVDALTKPRNFGKGTGLPETISLIDFTDRSLSWLSGNYQAAQKSAEYQTAMYHQAATSLSNATGVNKDDELALMLQLEQNYGAAAKIITSVSKMMDDLLSAVH